MTGQELRRPDLVPRSSSSLLLRKGEKRVPSVGHSVRAGAAFLGTRDTLFLVGTALPKERASPCFETPAGGGRVGDRGPRGPSQVCPCESAQQAGEPEHYWDLPETVRARGPWPFGRCVSRALVCVVVSPAPVCVRVRGEQQSRTSRSRRIMPRAVVPPPISFALFVRHDQCNPTGPTCRPPAARSFVATRIQWGSP